MRYWLYDEDSKSVRGPHLAPVLPKQRGFGPESKVAPEGARGPADWKAAKDVPELKVLFAAPAAPPPKPKP
jgi:hypothetical protein